MKYHQWFLKNASFYIKWSLVICTSWLITFSPAWAGFSRNVTVVVDNASQHKAFVDCNNVVLRNTAKKSTPNWKWQLVIYDVDRDALKNDVTFIGSRSAHRVGPHILEGYANLVSLSLNAICNNAPGQAARVPQYSQRRSIHLPLLENPIEQHQDVIQVRADPAPGGVGVRLSIQLDHLNDQSPQRLDEPLTHPTSNPENGTDAEESNDSENSNHEDCNSNNIPDDIDIVIGVDGDEDHDGIPNACEIENDSLRTFTMFGFLVLLLLIVFLVVKLRKQTR